MSQSTSAGVGLGFGSSAPGPSTRPKSTGSWQPLPFIHSGFCVHPFHPEVSPPGTPATADDTTRVTVNRNRFSWSGIRSSTGDDVGGEEGKLNAYEVPLDIGDEFFAFEEYRCTPEEDGRGDLWYRGYVVQAVSLPSLVSASVQPISLTHTASYPKPEPSVLIGIFPAAVVHVRPGAPNDNGELTEAYARALRQAEERSKNTNPSWVDEMGTVKEEDEAEGYDVTSPQKEVVDVEAQAQASASRTPDTVVRRQSIGKGAGGGIRSNRPKSLVLEQRPKENEEEDKEQPPLPKLTAGDSTISGQQWPLVDEIACAIREWYGRLPTYLANREYRLFGTVMQHIDALFLGRRQLLSQTLSGDELVRVRRECVSRLVKCNVAQGLEVIVRSLEDGSVMVVDKERAYSGASWVGGITCYVYQVQLAYIDLIPLDNLFGNSLSLIEPRSGNAIARPFSLTSAKTNSALLPSSGSHYHCLLDVRAFVANPCAPGESAELYFSLYNKIESRFVTEEFCLVLNHLGSPARDAEQRIGRLRTLFTDLKIDDLAHDIFLVCRIVRNGALKMRHENGSTAMRPNVAKRSSLYGIAEGSPGHHNPSMLDTMTDDSFSVTSGYGGHRAPTVDTSYTNGQSSTLDGRPTFRRPMGCAVLELPMLSKLLSDGAGIESNVPIYLPKDEAQFATLHEHVIHNRVKEFVTSTRAESIALSLKAFQGSADNIIREHPSLLAEVPLSARLGFPDVVYPGTIRNDLYVKLWSASFVPMPTSSGGSIRVRKSVMAAHHADVQVTIEVRRADGNVLQDAIVAGGSGSPPVAQYQSLVFHRNDRPTYGELLKITLPDDIQSEGYHLYLTFRSRGRDRPADQDQSELEKPFAFAYLPLAANDACINDGDHELMLYRSEKNHQPAPNIYFGAPALSAAEDGLTPTMAKAIFPLRDRVTLRTYLCSSVQTQDKTLRTLLAWAQNGSDMELLVATLKLFNFVSEEEIAKFVPSVFDALFSIMTSNLGDRQEEVDTLIFKTLMKVLAMSSDRRFPNFKSVLNIYVDTQFNYPASSFRLLASMRKVMSSPTTTDYRAFLKIWHLFFRFIIRSREHDRARGIGLDATSAHIEADFRKQTKAILGEINALMKSTDRALIGTQTLAVQHYADILADLANVFQPIEIAEIVIAFADTITFASGSIAIYKLLLLLQVVKSAFESSESRALLVPAIVRWIKPHLGRYEELLVVGKDDSQITKDGKRVRWLECNRLAVTVLAWTVNKLQEWHDSPLIKDDPSLQAQEEDNLEYCLTLLPSLYGSFFELSSPKTIAALHRQRSSSSSTIWKSTPDVFPISHPFALISELPPPSLLERHQNPGEDALPNTETFNCGLAETSVVILTLILASPAANITRWLNEVLDIEGISSLSATLKATFEFSRSVIRFDAFPKQWLTLNLMCFSSIFKFLEIISEIMEKETFIPPVEHADSFDIELWTSLFTLICELCGSDELALEDQSQQRRRAQWIITGDLRDQGAELLMRMWLAIGWTVESNQSGKMVDLKYGGYQTRFTGLAEQILSLCLSSHDGMCDTAVEILFSMIYAEYVIEGKFDSIETEIFAKLDKLFASRVNPASSDPTMRAYFVAQLRAVFESSPEIDSTFTTKVSTFLDEIELFIDLLLSLRDIPETPQWADERSLATYQLMNFVSRIGRNDLYVRFVYQLVGIAIEAKNWITAGLALQLHAETYQWKVGGELLDQLHEGNLNLPPQGQFARKEAIFYHAIDYFIEAEAYEFALKLVQDLTVQHQSLTFDINKLSELLHYQAKLWEQIGSSPRPKAEYFRVAYYGEWDQLNKDKDFVVRGQPWQRYSEFCDTLHLKHPSATLHRSKVPPPSSAREDTTQLIWVTPLTPEPDLTGPVFADTVPDNVQSYWRVNGVTPFSSARPYIRDASDMEGEAVLTWIEKTVLTTKESLPGILNRSEVIDVRYEQVPPVKTAIIEVEKATKNLRKLSKSTHGHLPESKLLGTAINGAVDSPVSGGVQTYRKVFLNGAYIEKHPEFAVDVDTLRLKIVEYVKTIQESLVVHKQVCKDMAFHEALKNQFYKAFSSEIALLPRLSNASTEDETPSISRSQSFGFSSDNYHNHAHPRSQPLTSPPTHPLPPLPNSSSYDSPRVSTYSDHSASASYKLPKLRSLGNDNGTGPVSTTGSYSASAGLSIRSTSTPRESTSTQRNIQTPIPGSSTSASNSASASASASANSPRRPGSRSSSLRKPPSENRLSWTGSGLGSVGLGRAMSIVGLSGKNDTAQPQAQQQAAPSQASYTHGYDNGGPTEESPRYAGSGNVNGNGNGMAILARSGSVNADTSEEPKKEKGLKRFGSLIRRGG